jgi:CCR4-NOT transcription complex subunit 3
MERFKACEKEMKTKAFSRAGLDAAAKLDPREILKRDLAEWVTTVVDDLNRQVEQAEAEVEALQGGGKKKSAAKAAAERVADVEAHNDRRKWHISRLEIVLRLLENGSLDPDKLNESSFKEDVKYFVEANHVRRLVARPGSVCESLVHRRRTLTRTRGFTTSGTWTRRKRPLA